MGPFCSDRAPCSGTLALLPSFRAAATAVPCCCNATAAAAADAVAVALLPQVKQSVLLKYRYMASFLKQHAPDIYAEVGGVWVGWLVPGWVGGWGRNVGVAGWEGVAKSAALAAHVPPACLLYHLPARLPAHLPACLPGHLPACLAGEFVGALQVRGAYVDKVGQTMLDLFRAYWAAMERLEVG